MKSRSLSKPRSIHFHEKATRICLRCGKNFRSQWKGHRRCHTCREYMRREEVSVPVQWEGCSV